MPPMQSRFLFLPSLALAAAVYLVPTDARACGGCIYGAPTAADASVQQNPSVVTDHRMVLAIDPEMTTLWDQIEYAGEPENFAWVLPIRGAVTVGLGSDAFIDGLDKKTAPRIVGPQVFCNPPPQPSFGGGGGGGNTTDYDYGSSASCACGAMSGEDSAEYAPSSTSVDTGTAGADGGLDIPDEGVVITERKAVGPYETVQIHGDGAESILGWLRRNKYVIPTEVEPVLNKYIGEKFDFLAVRLAPSADVHAMKPIRVSWKGAFPMLPLRMVAAGVGDSVGIKLFVIGDGRWKTKNFATFTISNDDLIWDFTIGRSNYTTLRADKAGLQDLHAFALESSINMNAYEVPGKDPDAPDGGLNMSDGAGEASETSEVSDGESSEAATDAASDVEADAVADAPAETSVDAAGLPPMIPATASDTDVAFGKKSFRRVTRLRADLPKRHLNVDLELEADDDQAVIDTTRRVIRQKGAETLCPFGVASVNLNTTSAALKRAEVDGKPQSAACNVGETRSSLKLPMLAIFGLAGVGLVRILRRKRSG
jgi:hypothetical protein